jgi:hypothetical protein
VKGRGMGSGSRALASREYRNSPMVSFRNMTEHCRSPGEKGRKSTSTSTVAWESMYTDGMGLKKALSLGISSTAKITFNKQQQQQQQQQQLSKSNNNNNNKQTKTTTKIKIIIDCHSSKTIHQRQRY